MVKFSIESCNCKETKSLLVGRRGLINSMGWRVPINSMHVLSWSHLCLCQSHAQPYVRVAHTRIVVVTPLLKAAFYEPCTAIRSRCSYQTALHKGVITTLRANAVFVYHTHTHTRTCIRPHTHSLCIVSQEPLVQLSLNFVRIWSVTRRSNHIKTTTWYEAILLMQMKVKGQISFRFLSQQPFVQFSPIFLCRWSVTRQSYCIIRSSWYAAILVMQMKVKGQISFSFVSQEPLVQLSSNFVCTLNVIWQSFHKITPTY